ncbi:MAG: hypothetical protein JW779_01610 [Candidatus Thorarchaeota archaeon]|nr:hypothetical protein [Candidatus Thorarchaeota archaeon]
MNDPISEKIWLEINPISLKEFNRAIQELKSDIEELATRIFTLEEKERARARDEHAREVSLDESWREGQDRDQFMFEGC